MSASADSAEVAHPAPAGEGRPWPLALLFAPDRAMERQARVGRARWYFVFAWVAALLLAAALAIRVDAASSTLRQAEMSGKLQGMSERQLADDTHNAERVFAVVSVAKAATGVPLTLGLGCLAMVGLSWFFRGRLKGSAVMPVVAATLLPGAVADLLDAFTVFRLTGLPPEGIPLTPRSLSAILALAGRPLMDPWLKLGGALDVFSLWAAVMMGYGLAAAGQVPKRTAVVGTLIAWVCYRLLTQVATGG